MGLDDIMRGEALKRFETSRVLRGCASARDNTPCLCTWEAPSAFMRRRSPSAFRNAPRLKRMRFGAGQYAVPWHVGGTFRIYGEEEPFSVPKWTRFNDAL